MNELNIGVIGCGFMGRTHSNAFGKVGTFFKLGRKPVLHTVCARRAERASAFANQWGYSTFETDWRKVVADPAVHLIDIATPNDTHAEIAIAAAAAGKMVMCEKPLGRNPAESESMVDAVEKAGVANMVWYNYRRVPAVTMAKQLIDEGRLGRIFHYRTQFLQDWTISSDLPQGGGRAVASRRQRRRQRRNRRSAGPQHRHRALAEWRYRRSFGDDRNLHQESKAQPHWQAGARAY